MSKVLELFGKNARQKANWEKVVGQQNCPYTKKRGFKVRKSEPDASIGTCTVEYGKENNPIIICPHRLIEKQQIFIDSIHLLQKHGPGNEIHILPEVNIPGGYVDYVLTSVKRGKVVDFVWIELQALDTTGTVWPARQRFLKEYGLKISSKDTNSKKPFGRNWKMTAKTILVQLHHKVKTFQHLDKHLVLVAQDNFVGYMKENFSFEDVRVPNNTDSMHFHSYKLSWNDKKDKLGLELVERVSTDSDGLAICLGLKVEANVELATIINILQERISDSTRLELNGTFRCSINN